MIFTGLLSINRLRKLKAIGEKADGFTLVEVLVAGILVMVSVVAVVAVVNTGSALERSNNDRRAARALIRSFFEQGYDLRDYNTVPCDTSFSENVIIEERQANPLNGILKTRIVTDTITNGTVEVPGKIISIACGWVEADGIGDSVALTKIYAKAR